MEIRPIHTEEDYHEALKEVKDLFFAAPGTPEGDKLEVLSVLVHAYEAEHFSFENPDPIDAIEYQMDRLGFSEKDLEPMVGSRSRVWEILHRKRPLTLAMIRKLSKGLGVSEAILVQDYEADTKEMVTRRKTSRGSMGGGKHASRRSNPNPPG
jgi:HTH-type transcriptional regulator/antitoxin HigA